MDGNFVIEVDTEAEALLLQFKAEGLQTTVFLPAPSPKGLRQIAAAFESAAAQLEENLSKGGA